MDRTRVASRGRRELMVGLGVVLLGRNGHDVGCGELALTAASDESSGRGKYPECGGAGRYVGRQDLERRAYGGTGIAVPF